MLNLPTRLRERDEPVAAGVVGAGLFGTNLIDQLERVPGLETAAVADIDTEKATDTLRDAGVAADDVCLVEDRAGLNDALANEKRAVVADGVELATSNVDVVVEATGVPDVGTRHAYEAIMAGNHVVMVTVEADAVVGPILAKMADRAGVTYSMAYGDQPALIAELYDWAETIGLDVVAAGKGNPYLPENRYGTPEDVFERWGFDPEFVKEQGLNARMYNSFLDGTKVAVEMAATANATGLAPDVPGMHIPDAAIPEIPEKLRPTEGDGLLNDTGVVETVSGLRPDGTEIEFNVNFGVFVVTTTPNERVQEYVEQNSGSGIYVASDGEYQVFYRPHHLPGLETPVSVANAAVRNEPTGVPRAHEAEVVGAAKCDLDPGDEIDGGGGYTVYGHLVAAEDADDAGYVPMELIDGATVTSSVERDEVLTYDDVTVDKDSFIYRLRRLQNGR